MVGIVGWKNGDGERGGKVGNQKRKKKYLHSHTTDHQVKGI